MPAAFAELSSTGSSREVVSSQWWTCWECPLSSSRTVLPITSGLNWLVSFVLTTQKVVPVALQQSTRILPLQIESANLWKPSMLIFSEPQTIGSDLSGSIREVCMCMG